jgi:hypothetical protein
VVMKLSWMANQTRPDLSYAVNTLAQYQRNCTETDWKAMLRILRYVRGTVDYGLYYQSSEGTSIDALTNEWHLPEAYADASHAQEEGRKSRSGYVIKMAGAAVSWTTKNQPVVAISSTEAESYALSEAVKDVLWTRHVFAEVGDKINGPTIIHQDNRSTIAIAENPIQHQRVKHMDVRVHFLRDHLAKNEIKLVWCSTVDMVADILTKALPTSTHTRMTQLLGIRSLAELQGHGKILSTKNRFLINHSAAEYPNNQNTDGK